MNWTFLVEASIILIAWYVCFILFFQKGGSHFAKRVYLLSGLFVSIVIPLLSIPVFPQLVHLAIEFPGGSPIMLPNDEHSFWWYTLIMFYASGCMLIAAKLINRLFRLWSLIRTAEVCHEENEIFHIIPGENKVASFGGYILISKDELHKNLSIKIAHEKAHIAQVHTLDILLLSVYQIFFWFNPVSWLIEKKVKEIHEYLADESTIRDHPNYAIQLIESAIDRVSAIPVTNSYYSFIQKRIDMLKNKRRNSLWLYLISIPLLSGFLYSFSFTTYPVIVPQNTNGLTGDTIPNKLTDVDSFEVIDTLVVFDAETYEETVTIIKSKMSKKEYFELHPPANSESDTILIFDPNNNSETLIVKNIKTGQRDTIYLDHPAHLKKGEKIMTKEQLQKKQKQKKKIE
jgi:hypothetical protein